MEMAAAGQLFAHMPQPMHFSRSTTARMPILMRKADFGHTSIQHPQATQSFAINAVLTDNFIIASK
jgi:hypothetical protein